LGSLSLAHPTAQPLRQEAIQRLQHDHGNAHVQRVVSGWHAHSSQRSAAVQRDDNDMAATAAPDAAAQPKAADGPLDLAVSLSQAAPIAVRPEDVPGYGPGDYPTRDDPNVAMAKHLDSAVVQRDGPKPGVDVQAQYPWSLQMSFVYRDLNMAAFRKLDFGHEPTVQFAIDPSGKLSTQVAIGLVNLHWIPPWKAEIEAQIQPFANFTLLPKLASAYGGTVQAEQHILPWVGLTISANGTWTLPQSGNPGTFKVDGNAGVVLHLDKLFK
jgi:hypothetical protein